MYLTYYSLLNINNLNVENELEFREYNLKLYQFVQIWMFREWLRNKTDYMRVVRIHPFTHKIYCLIVFLVCIQLSSRFHKLVRHRKRRMNHFRTGALLASHIGYDVIILCFLSPRELLCKSSWNTKY